MAIETSRVIGLSSLSFLKSLGGHLASESSDSSSTSHLLLRVAICCSSERKLCGYPGDHQRHQVIIYYYYYYYLSFFFNFFFFYSFQFILYRYIHLTMQFLFAHAYGIHSSYSVECKKKNISIIFSLLIHSLQLIELLQ